MDDIVRQAMAKWPNVPHCYGWLALDARGNWRMRDERAQKSGLSGDRIGNAALLGFINRNYQCDEKGRWFFQNGPQRVYVNLEATPFIARTDPLHGFVLHTGAALEVVDVAWMTEDGLLVLQGGGHVAQVDDRDMAQCLGWLHIDGEPAGDEAMLKWIESGSAPNMQLTLDFGGRLLPVHPVRHDALAAHFGFVQAPQPD